jgi:aspartyl protease family protein
MSYAIHIAAAESRITMSSPDDKGPWRETPPKRSATGLLLWLALLALVGIGIWQLSSLFPGQLDSGLDQAYLIQAIVILAVLSSGLIFARRIPVKETVRNIAIWVAIAVILIVGLSFRDEIESIAMRVRSELVPGYALETGEHEMVLTESSGGNFFIYGEANGVRVRFLIDTGASDTVLSPSDAMSLGIQASDLDFSRVYQTANGMGRGAPYTLESLSVGPISFPSMPVSINETEMSSSLLGMTFLRRLRSFEIQGRRLILRY